MTTEQRRAFWSEKMAAWKASGLSGQAFCQQHELTYHQFGYWRRKLQDQEQAPSGFARVVAATGAAPSTGLRVSLPSGLSISGIDAGNIALVGEILRQL